MESIFAAIAVALGPGATSAERQRGAVLCRALADQLDPSTVVALPPAPCVASDAASSTSAARAGATSGPGPDATPLPPANPFAGLTADQIFDLAIAKLRGAVGADEPLPAPLGQPFRIPLVPVPRLR